ncbi:MAG: hypothetical protein Q8M07_18860 [Prosthecobacter sp.]|nr:hypothetical protein [Prosthecobacter sp.]
MARLAAYCEAGRGRKTALIKHLGIPPPRLSEWLSGGVKPGGETTLAIQEWLAAQGAA